MEPRTYWVRHGQMHRVGRFVAEGGPLERGQWVVIRSPRGTELGEVLAPASGGGSGPDSRYRVLRAAGHDDRERARSAERERPERLAACERVFRDGVWPLELIDVEPLLDERRTILYYLGPHHLDADGLIQAFRESLGLDVLLEPVGRDEPALNEEPVAPGCGSGGCGSDGGCGAGSGPDSTHSGCSGCSVRDLLAGRRRRAVPEASRSS